MQRTIELGMDTYAYTLRKSLRTRRLRLSVSAGGALAVSAPYWVSGSFIERFLQEHADWIGEKVKLFERFSRSPLARGGKREYAQHREVAQALAENRLAHFNQVYGFTYRRISVRNQKTRWGSCSKQGNLSFNYRIALLPPELADYVILHELCHLGALDHSPRFWTLVARAMPDHADRRRALRRLGAESLS